MTENTFNLAARIEQIMATPLVHPAFDIHEALFYGNARAKLLRAKLTKSGNGADQIIIEGVVTSTHKLMKPAALLPENNPQGWDATAFSEIMGADGTRFPELGPMDVTGYRFVYAGTLSEGIGAEMLVNNLRLLGWKPERVKAPLTGQSLMDFAPEEGADFVSADDLGMSEEVNVKIVLKDATENFGARIQVNGFKLADVRVTKKEAASLDSRFGSLLKQSLSGRVDSRKEKEKAAPPSRRGAAPAATAAGTSTASDGKKPSEDDMPF